jgi:UDP-glucose 4-epimerase
MKNIPIALKSGKIIVTGGNGFVGGHVVDRLIERGFKVTILDRFKKPHRDDVKFVLGDVRDKTLVFDLMAKHDGIINLAGILGTSETINNPFGTVSSNIKGALNVFLAAKEHVKRAVHITVGNHWMNNPYAITKSASEKIALNINLTFGTKIAVVRGMNAYGERQKDYPVRKLIPNLLIPALSGSEILIYGDGEQKMDMIYVGDLAEVLVRALVLEHGCWDKIIEGGSGDAPTVNEICSTVMQITNSSSKIKHIPMRAGEPDHAVVVGNPETLKPLGIGADYLLSLEDGIKKSRTYYQTQVDNSSEFVG